MLPTQTAKILEYMGYEPEIDFRVQDRAGTIVLQWLHSDPEPSEQVITDHGDDVTIIGAQAFSAWFPEHGGDPVLTAKREARERIVSNRDLVAILKLIRDQFNVMRKRDRDRNTEVQAAATLGDLKTRWAGLATLNDVTDQQLADAVDAAINQ